MSAEIRIPSILRIGGGSFGEAGVLLAQLGCKRPLIVTDPFLMRRGLRRGCGGKLKTRDFVRGFFMRRWRTRLLT